MKPVKDINKVKDEHSEELMKINGVVGVYVTEMDDKTPCIAVMVVKKSKELELKIPKYIDGYKVIIDETGEIKPMEK